MMNSLLIMLDSVIKTSLLLILAYWITANLSEILSHLHSFCLLVGYKIEVVFF